MSDRYKIDLNGTTGTASVTVLLTPSEVETIRSLADALNDAPVSEDEFAPKLRIELVEPPHQGMVEQLREERSRVKPATATNPVYNAYSRAISSLMAVDSTLYVESYEERDK